MLTEHLKERAPKGRFAAEPFVDQYAQSILIAGGTRVALNLFRGHVDGGARWMLRRVGDRAPYRGRIHAAVDDGNAKIREHHLVIGSEEHILRFNIPVDHALLMS